MVGRPARLNDLSVWHFVPPADTWDATKAAQAETIQYLLLFGICWPALAAMHIYRNVLMRPALYTPILVVSDSPRHGGKPT